MRDSNKLERQNFIGQQNDKWAGPTLFGDLEEVRIIQGHLVPAPVCHLGNAVFVFMARVAEADPREIGVFSLLAEPFVQQSKSLQSATSF